MKLRQFTWPAVFTGVILGLIAWGGFNSFIEYTNTTEFCISCHEMENTVYREFTESVHYTNPAGVRVGCADCHVPRPLGPKMWRKLLAGKDIYHTLMGTIDTPEKFEARRMHLAENVWKTLETTDSRECRNCHSFQAMDFEHQSRRAQEKMKVAMQKGKSCIECHKGIAHQLPAELLEDDD